MAQDWFLTMFIAGLASLYLVKALVLARERSVLEAVAMFTVFLAAFLMVLLITCPERPNPWLSPWAIYVGNSLAIITVPYVSFFYDLARRESGLNISRWWWRIPLELLVAYGWLYVGAFMALSLGWVAI